MKKILAIIVLTGIVFVGDRLFSYIISHLVLGSGTKFSTTYRGGQSNQILILGNSRGDSSFSPVDIENATGLSTFQLSHKGISTEIIECLWKDYIENNAPPEIFILEITNVSSTNKALYNLKPFMYWSNNFTELLYKEDIACYFSTKLSNLYIWNGEMLFRSLYFYGKSDQNKIIHNKKRINSESIENLSKINGAQKEIPIRQSNIDSLLRIVQSAREQNVTVFLIFPPYIPQYEEVIDDSKNRLINLISSNLPENVFVYDFSKSIDDIRMFEDFTHLNYYGAQYLLRLMLEKNILPMKNIKSTPGLDSHKHKIAFSGL